MTAVLSNPLPTTLRMPVPGEPRCGIYDLPVSGCAHCQAKPAKRRPRGPMSDEARTNLSAAQRAVGRHKAVNASAQLAAARLRLAVLGAPRDARHLAGTTRFVVTDRMLWIPAERVLVDVHRIGPFGRTICGLRIEYGAGERTVQLGLFVTAKQAIALVGQACHRCGFVPAEV